MLFQVVFNRFYDLLSSSGLYLAIWNSSYNLLWLPRGYCENSFNGRREIINIINEPKQIINGRQNTWTTEVYLKQQKYYTYKEVLEKVTTSKILYDLQTQIKQELKVWRSRKQKYGWRVKKYVTYNIMFNGFLELEKLPKKYTTSEEL